MKYITRLAAFAVAALLTGSTLAATAYNQFVPANGILKGATTTPVTTAAAWSDVQLLLSGTCNSSVFVRGDGTCVAVSLTANVSGTLPVANGGTNLTSATDDSVMVGNGTTWQSKALTDCDSATSAVTYDVTTNAWGCNSITSITGAALTKADDTNVTLTLGGSPTTALVNAASITAGWTGTLAASRGGTGVSSLGTLTKADDTNVTLTLGGTPTGALINSTSITAGWTGTLAASRGGLGMSTVTDDTLAVANGSTWQSKALADCDDTSGNHLNYDTGTNVFSCGTSSSAAVSGANPSASVGLSAVNGVATTYLRSDGAPALSQAIAPTWTSTHTFSPSSGRALTATGVNNQYTAFFGGSATSGQSFGVRVQAGTTAADSALEVTQANTARSFMTILGNGATSFGNATDNPSYAFLGSGGASFAGMSTYAYTGSGEQIRLARDNAFLSFYNAANTTRRGYLQGSTGGGMTLASEEASQALALSTNGGTITADSQIAGPSGSAGTPAFSFGGDNDTGAYRAAANSVGFSAGGTLQLYYDTASIIGRQQIQGINGSAATPSFGFENDTDTGVFSGGNNSNALNFTAGGALRAGIVGNANVLRLYGVDTVGDTYMSFNDSAQAVKAYVGFVNGADDTFYVDNEENSAMVFVNNAAARTTIAADGGMFMAGATGSSQGSGTINAAGLYINGVAVSGGTVTTGTFTATLTGMTGTVNCSMKWRLTGSRVDLFLDSGSACTGTSNSTAMTMTGLPAAIQPSATAWLPCLGVDSSATAFSSCFIDTGVSASTIRMDRSVVSGTVTNFSSAGWTNSGTKGIPIGWDVTYDLRN